MTADKNIENNFKYLDAIISHLIEKVPSYSIHIDVLYKEIFSLGVPKSYYGKGFINFVIHFGDGNFNLADFNFTADTFDAHYAKFIFACNHLIKNNYLSSDGHNNVIITYKGIIKHTEGFVTEYRKQSIDEIRLLNVENFQRKTTLWMLWVNGSIAVGTLIAAIYYILEMIKNCV